MSIYRLRGYVATAAATAGVIAVIAVAIATESTTASAQGTQTTTSVSSVVITSTNGDSDVEYCDYSARRIGRNAGVYGIGEKIEVTVTFTDDVTVAGTSSVALTVGTATKTASYDSSVSDEDDEVTFSYTVVEGDVDTDGISIASNSISASNGASIIGSGNQAANLNHDELTNQESHRVDGVRPSVTEFKLLVNSGHSGAGDVYIIGDEMQALATFSERVFVNGDLTANADFGGAATPYTLDCSWYSPTNSVFGTRHWFAHEVQEGDIDANGASVPAGSISLNEGMIIDAAGNAPTDLSYPAKSDHRNLKVDGVRATYESAATSEDGTQVTVTFNEDVTTPALLQWYVNETDVALDLFIVSVLDVMVDEEWAPRNAAAISGRTITFTLLHPVTQGQTVTVAYDGLYAMDAPDVLQDMSRNHMKHFGSSSVTNNSTVADSADQADIHASVETLTFDEGLSSDYTVKLGSQPSADVTVTIADSPDGKVTLSNDSLTFTQDNWNTPQTVTVTASADDNSYNYWVNLAHTASEDHYSAAEYIRVLLTEPE